MKKLNCTSVGLAVGIFCAVVHILWSLTVAVGLAQVFLDLVYGLHFLNNPFVVAQFDLTKAVGLAILTFVLGYLGGCLFASVWNRGQK